MTDPLPPFPDSRLEDPVYRADLLAKLEALISVLEVARAKVIVNLGSQEREERDLVRLRRVRTQVENTLSICRQARKALQGGDAITADEILGTDIDALCQRLVSGFAG